MRRSESVTDVPDRATMSPSRKGIDMGYNGFDMSTWIKALALKYFFSFRVKASIFSIIAIVLIFGVFLKNIS